MFQWQVVKVLFPSADYYKLAIDLGFDLKVEDEASSSKDPSPTTSVAKDSTTTNYLPRRSSLTHAVTELNLDEDVLRQLAEAGEDIPGENGSSVPRIPPEKPKKDLAITPPDPSSPHTRAPLASPPAHNSSILLNGITEIASPLPGEEAVEPLDKIYLFSKSDLVNHRYLFPSSHSPTHTLTHSLTHSLTCGNGFTEYGFFMKCPCC